MSCQCETVAALAEAITSRLFTSFVDPDKPEGVRCTRLELKIGANIPAYGFKERSMGGMCPRAAKAEVEKILDEWLCDEVCACATIRSAEPS